MIERWRYDHVLRKIASVRQQLQELEEELAALAADLAGPAPRLPQEFPRKVEIIGEQVIALADRLRALPLAADNHAPRRSPRDAAAGGE